MRGQRVLRIGELRQRLRLEWLMHPAVSRGASPDARSAPGATFFATPHGFCRDRLSELDHDRSGQPGDEIIRGNDGCGPDSHRRHVAHDPPPPCGTKGPEVICDIIPVAEGEGITGPRAWPALRRRRAHSAPAHCK